MEKDIKVPGRYEKAINEFVERVLDKFGDRVVSIVLFGSVAKGTSRETSDVDLLVVMKDLPAGWRERDKVLDDIVMDFILKGVRMFPIVVSPEAMENSAKIQNPLFYGILTGYEILYDPRRFFEYILDMLRSEIKTTHPVYIEGGKEWHLAEMV